MHWACYSKCEIALSYLLAWVEDVDDADGEGLTPLHLAVKKSEDIGSTRPVKALLIKGASREARDKLNRTPMDLVADLNNEFIKQELVQILKKPNYCSCLMLRTPLTLVRKNVTT